MHQSKAFGLTIASNVPVPGLPAFDIAGSPDVVIRLGLAAAECWPVDRAAYRSNDWSDAGLASGLKFYRDTTHIGIRYRDGTEFFVSRDGDAIWGTWPDELTLEDTATYLLGPIFNILLRLRGTLSLHGSAVRIGGAAAMFVGPQGAGKSTTAAIFAAAGDAVLTDDIAALAVLDGEYCIQPSYPRIRLWPTSVEMLFGSSDVLPLLTPTWDKRFLELGAGGYKFQSDPVPLAAIYLLAPDGEGRSAPQIGEVAPRDALLALIGNTHANYLLDEQTPDQSFALLQQIVATIPVRRLTRGGHGSSPTALREVVMADMLDLGAGQLAASQHV